MFLAAISCEITQDMAPPHHTYWKVFDEYGLPSQAEAGKRVNYNSAIEYSCAKGYSMIGEPRRSCKGRDNYWSGRRVYCEEGKINNGIQRVCNAHRIVQTRFCNVMMSKLVFVFMIDVRSVLFLRGNLRQVGLKSEPVCNILISIAGY